MTCPTPMIIAAALVNPVLSGFTSAAAIIIGVGQVKHVLGYDVPRFEHFYEQVGFLFTNITHTN
ncbi:MAG: SulP family inorganic anion transporter, partial [Chloroflexota bacterium]